MRALAIALAFCEAAGCLAIAAPARRALVIGNGSYTRLPRLEQSQSNAEAVAKTLREIQFDTTLQLDLDQQNLNKAIRTFQAAIQPGDITFIYYSGYAYTSYALQEEPSNWLLPVGFDSANDRGLSFNAYLLANLLNDRAPDSGPMVVVIDAITEAPQLSRGSEGLANNNVDSKTLLCFSQRPGAGSKPQSGAGPGVFAKSLAAALKVPGIEPLQIFGRVQDEVASATTSAQVPLFVPFTVPRFYFVEPPPTPELPPPTATTPVLTAGTKRENPQDGLDYVWIPQGVFKMGCVPSDKYCAEDEKPQHQVTITKGFWITRTEVTVSGYARFASANKLEMPKATQTNPGWKFTEHPISKVDWAAADAYCKWAGGALPSEAQWEYAARGGADDQVYPWGNEYNAQLANTMNTKGSEKRKFPETFSVKFFLKNPNRFDMFDVAGNVREWTMDTYNPGAYQRGNGASDPVELSAGKEKVARGGSFNGGMKDVRLSGRDHLDPVKEATNQTGFRCVMQELK